MKTNIFSNFTKAATELFRNARDKFAELNKPLEPFDELVLDFSNAPVDAKPEKLSAYLRAIQQEPPELFRPEHIGEILYSPHVEDNAGHIFEILKPVAQAKPDIFSYPHFREILEQTASSEWLHKKGVRIMAAIVRYDADDNITEDEKQRILKQKREILAKALKEYNNQPEHRSLLKRVIRQSRPVIRQARPQPQYPRLVVVAAVSQNRQQRPSLKLGSGV